MENLIVGKSSTSIIGDDPEQDSNPNNRHSPRTRNKDNNTKGYNRQNQRGSNGRGHLSKNYPNEGRTEQTWKSEGPIHDRYTQPRIYHRGNMKISMPPHGSQGHIYHDLNDSQKLPWTNDRRQQPCTNHDDNYGRSRFPVREESRISFGKASVASTLQASTSFTMPFEKYDLTEKMCAMWPVPRVPNTRKKLLILDVNGLLADVVSPPPKCDKGDIIINRRAIFKRPFLNDFLRFCFERFDVAIWSSRSKKILDNIVDYLLGDMRCKLLFCWDQSQCTNTRFKTLENKHKDLFLKEVKKVWERLELDYDESNTLLLDDSPYKALLNPIHSAIFPYTYSYKDKSDNSLGVEGDLRVYLTGLATTENVKRYVEEHPFGQRPIDETNSSWAFYLKVIRHQQGPRQKFNQGGQSSYIAYEISSKYTMK